MNRLMFILMNWLQLVISDALKDSGSDKRLINILGNKELTRGFTSLALYFHIFGGIPCDFFHVKQVPYHKNGWEALV